MSMKIAKKNFFDISTSIRVFFGNSYVMKSIVGLDNEIFERERH